MRKLKTSYLILSIMFILNIFITVNAAENINNKNETSIESELTVEEVGHGEFKIVSDIETKDLSISSSSSVNNNNNKGKIKKVRYDDDEIYDILDEEILQADKEYDKLMRVNDSTFLRVKEIKIDLLKRTQLEGVILKYEVNDDLAKSLLDLSDKAIEDKENNKKNSNNIFSLYTPKKVKNNNDEKTKEVTASYVNKYWLNDYYYTGYNNKKYLDETIYINYISSAKLVKTGYSVSNYWDDVINNFSDYISSSIAETIIGPAYVVAQTITPNPVVTYEPNSGDNWDAKLIEYKYRRHTSIYAYDSNVGWRYETYAYGERGSYKFYNITDADGNIGQGYSPISYFTSNNYYSLDKKVYNQWYYNKGMYFERYDRYSVNKYTWFGSGLNLGY